MNEEQMYELHNPHNVEAENFSQKLENFGFVTLENVDGFEYHQCDLSKVPLKMRVEFYTIEIDRIAYDILNEIVTNEHEDLYYNCMMLYKHTINLIKETHC